jgi:fatty acid desaturase
MVQQGYLLGSFLFGVFGWLLGAIGHDGGHYAVSRNPIINDYAVWGMSLLCNPIMWQHQHTYAHHSYTNEFDRDPDLHHFDMFMRYHKRYIPHPVYKNQAHRIFVILAFGFTCFGQCYLIPLRFIQERSLYGAVNWSDRQRLIRPVLLFLHFIAYSVIIMAVPFFVHESTLVAGLAALLPMVISGWLFAFCSQIGHVTEMCMDGKQNEEEKAQRHPHAQDSWAAGQVATTNDFCPQSSLWHFLANGLSLQVEHHLFPGLNHCHLMLIQPTIEEACKEYNVKYKKYESWGAIMEATFEYLNKLAID